MAACTNPGVTGLQPSSRPSHHFHPHTTTIACACDRAGRLHRKTPVNTPVDKLGLLNKCGITWISPAVRQWVVDGLADPTHAAILSRQSPEASLQVFAQKAAELQQNSRRRLSLDTLPTVRSTYASTQHGCFKCGRTGHNDKERRQPFQTRIHYQACHTPRMSIHVEGIGDLSPLVDTGAERTALHRRHAPDTM
ncbi:hypothetical protein HPB51_017586 [Rhipicephalus microplus]|uniref:Peptidase A2 domain-containing protein n=1 Tax=Rhipicephalus microplus TaxID=6941 RepID=A0A9J6F4L9_RHIMP|nr:hypothetical protein HPB51_017586 [Rhipicephalus microplus]